MASMLRAVDVEAQILDPVGLPKLVDDLTSPTTVSGEDVVDYNRFDPIADQAVRRDMEIVTDTNRILIRTERFRAPGALKEGVPDLREDVRDRSGRRWYTTRQPPPPQADCDPRKHKRD